MTVGNDQTLIFVKSSYSNGQGDCVEVAKTPDGGRVVRDSKNPEGATLDFTPREWTAFLLGAKDGEFDD
jgi:hypothetical protein